MYTYRYDAFAMKNIKSKRCETTKKAFKVIYSSEKISASN